MLHFFSPGYTTPPPHTHRYQSFKKKCLNAQIAHVSQFVFLLTVLCWSTFFFFPNSFCFSIIFKVLFRFRLFFYQTLSLSCSLCSFENLRHFLPLSNFYLFRFIILLLFFLVSFLTALLEISFSNLPCCVVFFSLVVYCDKVKRSFCGLAHLCHWIQQYLPKESPHKKQKITDSCKHAFQKLFMCILEGVKCSSLNCSTQNLFVIL